MHRVRSHVFWGLMGAVVAVGLLRLYGPFSVVRQQSVQMAQLRAAKASLLAEQSSLEDQRRFLATGRGREEAARRMGYVRPGERRVVFVPAAAGKGAAQTGSTGATAEK